MNSKSNPEPSDMVTAELRDWGRDRPDAETDLHLCEVIRQSWVELSQPAVPSTRSDRPGRRRVLWLRRIPDAQVQHVGAAVRDCVHSGEQSRVGIAAGLLGLWW